MRYRIILRGLSPLVCRNGAAGLDTRSPANIEKGEITRKKTSDRTEVDDVRLRELECLTTLYLDEGGAPTLPASAFRASIETAARKLRHGPKVREGLVGGSSGTFPLRPLSGHHPRGAGPQLPVHRWGEGRGEPCVAYPGPVRPVGRHDPRRGTDPELVDRDQLLRWLDIGGRRVGVGDWRPEKIGTVRSVRGGGHRTASVETFFLAWLGVAWLGEAWLGSAWHGRAWTPPTGVGKR